MKASKSMILKAIAAKCMDCCCGEKSEVKLCTAVKCPIYEFRLGKAEVSDKAVDKIVKPRKKMSEEHKAAMKAGREAAKANK